jgi:hypothetical protein
MTIGDRIEWLTEVIRGQRVNIIFQIIGWVMPAAFSAGYLLGPTADVRVVSQVIPIFTNERHLDNTSEGNPPYFMYAFTVENKTNKIIQEIHMRFSGGNIVESVGDGDIERPSQQSLIIKTLAPGGKAYIRAVGRVDRQAPVSFQSDGHSLSMTELSIWKDQFKTVTIWMLSSFTIGLLSSAVMGSVSNYIRRRMILRALGIPRAGVRAKRT